MFCTLIHGLFFNTPVYQEYFNKEVRTVKDIALFSGYKENIIEKVIM